MKHGHYVPDHLHLNVTYGLITDKETKPKFNNQEHSDIRWFKLTEYIDSINEERMIPIYKKLIKVMI